MRNFKLLLATTAILSTTAMVANAEHANYQSVGIGAYVNFRDPISATTIKELGFGILEASSAAGKSLTVNPDGTYSGTVKVLGDSGDIPLQAAEIKFHGGRFNEGYANDDSISLHLDGKEIELKDDNKLCGKVTNLIQGEISSNDGGTELTVHVGGTLEISDTFTSAYSCVGNTTLTYVYNEWQ